MDILLIIISMICSVLLIGAVLIQPGKADMISGMGGIGGQVTNMFGVSSGRNIIQNITVGLLVAIVLISILVNTVFLSNGGQSATKNALQGTPKSAIPTQLPPPSTPAR